MDHNTTQAPAGISQQPDSQKLPGVGRLLSESWQIARSKGLSMFGVVFLPAVALMLVATLFLALSYPFDDGSLNALSLGIMGVLFLALIVFLSVWLRASFAFAVRDAVEGTFSIKKSWSQGLRKWLPFLWIYILGYILINGGFYLVFIPGIVFAVWFFAREYIIVNEDVRGMNAVLKSKAYTAGYFWAVLGRIAALILFGLLILAAFAVLLAILGVGFGDAGAVVGVAVVAAAVIGVIGGILVLIMFSLYTYLIYFYLHKIKGSMPEFKATNGQKALFIIIGIIGLLVGLSFNVLSSDFFQNLENAGAGILNGF